MGTFAKGFNKTYSAAFAIVNAESNVKLRITKVDFGASDNIRTYAVIALHENMSTNAFSESSTDGAYIIYFDKGTAYDYSMTGYVLRNGQGDYSAGSLKYTSNDGGAWTDATWDDTNKVWVYHTDLVNANVSADSGSPGNFVWVQITLDFSTAPDGTDFPNTQNTLYINVKSV
ncbi:MAG: hypothetical protein ACP5LE_02035 [Thermoplasmata archaeon]